MTGAWIVGFYVGVALGVIGGYSEAVKRVSRATIARFTAPLRRRIDRKMAEHSDDREAQA